MSEDDSLNWDSYPSFDDIHADSKHTVIVGLRSDPIEKMYGLFEMCKKEFPKSNFIGTDYIPEIIIKKSNTIATASICYNCITVRMHEFSEILKKTLEDFFLLEYIMIDKVRIRTPEQRTKKMLNEERTIVNLQLAIKKEQYRNYMNTKY